MTSNWLKEVVAGWESVWLGKPRSLGRVDPAKFVVDVGQSASQSVKIEIVFTSRAHNFIAAMDPLLDTAWQQSPDLTTYIFNATLLHNCLWLSMIT